MRFVLTYMYIVKKNYKICENILNAFTCQQPDSNGNPTTPSVESNATTRLFQAYEEELQQNSSSGGTGSSNNSSTDVDSWEISINQFIATVLAVTSIVQCFYMKTPIKENIERMQKNRRKCVITNY